MKRMLCVLTLFGGLAAMMWREYPAIQRYLKIRSM
jgi:hypothetical protein